MKMKLAKLLGKNKCKQKKQRENKFPTLASSNILFDGVIPLKTKKYNRIAMYANKPI
jgi:hypothetical protein